MCFHLLKHNKPVKHVNNSFEQSNSYIYFFRYEIFFFSNGGDMQIGKPKKMLFLNGRAIKRGGEGKRAGHYFF